MPDVVAWVLAWGFVFVAGCMAAFALWGGPLVARYNRWAAEREARRNYTLPDTWRPNDKDTKGRAA